MIGFWILAALTLVAAYAFFAPALLGKTRRSAVDRQKLNLELHRQRREELVGEFAGKELENLQTELDKDLLGDLTAAENTKGASQPQGRGSLIAALAVALLLGILLYSQLGRFDLADFRAEAQTAPQRAGASEFQDMIDHLAQRLQTDGGDLKGWMLLGRSYQQIEQYDKAAEAYAHALKLAPDNLDIKAFYAETLGESLDGNYAGEPARLAAEVLAKDPKHHNALWVAGAGAAQSGDTRGAIGYLETLRGEFPKDSADEKHLSKIIGDLKNGPSAEAEAEEAPAPAQAKEPATGEQKAIKVKVTLAAALKAKAAPTDTVFIFARAASGPPMPLAIVRKQVKDLPVEVRLDDSMGMIAGMNLSAFDRVVIGARISKSGQAMPQPGDLQGLAPATAIQNGAGYVVEIVEEIK